MKYHFVAAFFVFPYVLSILQLLPLALYPQNEHIFAQEDACRVLMSNRLCK